MSEAKPVTVERARETLERFIAEHERVVAELREKLDEQVQITARIANENASNRLRAERAEVRVAELERFHDVVQTAMQIHVIDEDAIKWIEQQLAAMQGGEATAWTTTARG